jgi:hypothetical protein
VRHLRASDLLPGAQATARAWASDAALVYVENADSLAADGSARAWTFVYSAAERGEARAFTYADSGRVTSVVLPFAFEAAPLEGGWIEPSALVAGFIAADPAARAAAARAEVAVLSHGLLPGRAAGATTWYVGAIRGPGAILDALRGTTMSTTGPGLVGEDRGIDAPAGPGLPAFLSRHRAAFLARLEARKSDPAHLRRDRPRSLLSREGGALERLAITQAWLDTLGHGEVNAAGRELERALADLAAWRAGQARSESLLATSEARLVAAERELATARPTEFALYVATERRARPAALRVLVDGTELVRRTYGTPEWNALDAGAWAEVVRATVRPGAREVRVEVETADRRVTQARWTGALPEGAMTLLRLALRGPGEGGEPAPRLDRLPEDTP